MPSWVGDAVMATPALRLLRDRLRGSFIGALMRPGIDELLAGSGLVDEMHVERASGMMGPKRLAAKVRPRQYESALLFTNSFSTALVTRLAFIPERVGYDRDGRGLLLTRRIKPRLRSADAKDEGSRVGSGRYAVESAVAYYLRAAGEFLDPGGGGGASGLLDERFNASRLELALTDEQERASRRVLERAGVLPAADAMSPDTAPVPVVILNPGANNPAKRWPAERFAAIGAHLARRHGWRVLVNGSPAERELVNFVVRLINNPTGASAPASSPFPASSSAPAVSLIDCGISMGALKGVVRHARLMVTNDTGPRHIAAAFGVPTLTLFGPTDPRWTTLPPHNARSSINLVADPTLPESLVADDHPERCAIERISLERATDAVQGLIDSSGTPRTS